MRLSSRHLLISTISIALTVIPMEGSIAATKRQCSMHNSAYKAIGNPDFELTFSPRIPNLTMDAVVTLKHSNRGEIKTFHVVTSQGYGSSFLIDPDRDDRTILNIVVFDRNLEPDRIFRNEVAPEYAFVAGLGSRDYYGPEGGRKFMLGDRMWKFDRCL
jgi:hypothetical protein